jgi:murein DD-endopeptidase MepM/ murein hydrolase activator NlpD
MEDVQTMKRIFSIAAAGFFLSGCAVPQKPTSSERVSTESLTPPNPAVPSTSQTPADTSPLLNEPSTTATSQAVPPTDPALTVQVPFAVPLATKAKIVSGYGKRNVVKPNAPAGAPPEPEAHEGVDFRVAPGASVYAAQAGKVLFAGFSKEYVSRADKKQQHRFVIIRHADGKSTRYVHLNTVKVRPGLEVAAGDIIGTASDSDEWKDPVLHFEIRDEQGKPLNPVPLLSSPTPQ